MATREENGKPHLNQHVVKIHSERWVEVDNGVYIFFEIRISLVRVMQPART